MPNVKKRGVCTMTDCSKSHFARGYCSMHYGRFRRHGTPTPGNLPVSSEERYNSRGERKCSSCRKYLSVHNFGKAGKSTPDRLQIYCRGCLKAKRAAKNYGLSESTVTELLDTQNGQCAICEVIFNEGTKYVIDHDHTCCPGTVTCGGCVRGILCITCNVRLGVIENKVFTGNAVKYLARSCRVDGANKGEVMQDLYKARKYVEREIERMQIESLKDYKAKLMQDANGDTIS